MRKRYRVLLLAALVAALVVPVGFALSVESPAARVQRVATTTANASTIVASAAVTSPRSPIASTSDPVPDAAKLLLVGTMLFGLAAFVRRAV